MSDSGFKKDVGDIFGAFDNDAEPSAAEESAARFSDNNAKADVKSQPLRIRKLDIKEIRPDPLQPRRVIIGQLREFWDGQDVSALLKDWIDFADIDPLAHMQNQDDDDDISDVKSPEATTLLTIIELAYSIRVDGLTNPITVASDERGYLIETGERRWLAYNLLALLYPDEANWKKIPARVMSERSVWRQATENNQRDNLNAIAKARQYSLLMMAALQESGETIEPREAFDNEQAYYAQVADARVPRGYGERIRTSMGFQNRSTINRYRDLLTIDFQVWQQADDYNCPEGALRNLNNLSPKQQRDAFNAWLQSQTGTNVATGNNSQKRAKKDDRVKQFSERQTKLRDRVYKDVVKGRNLSQWEQTIRDEIEEWQSVLNAIDAKRNDG